MTGCQNTTAPINLEKGGKYQDCTEKCKLIYKYGLSNCTVENKGTYLDIECASAPNVINYGGSDLTVSSVRLYLKSLNTYDGFNADGELIITHTAGGGKNVYICIPIVNNEKSGTSSKWFSKIIPFSPTKKNTSIPINVNNFTLNDVIPQSAFYIFDGGTFSWGCNNKDEMIIFHKDQAINMKNREFKTLASLIKSESMVKITPKADEMNFNKKGTSNGPGESPDAEGKSLTCTPVEDGESKSLYDTIVPSTKGVASVDTSTGMDFIQKYKDLIIGIIVGLIIICILGYIIRKSTNRGNNVGGPARSGSG
jgi:carbonic anhydrase